MVSEYVQEIFEYMRELEIQTMPNAEYMNVQKELQWKMRSILIDWLIEVHHKFRLLAETLYLTVNIIDRFLSVRVISLVKLQLVGVTAMFIAAKYEEVVAPSIKNFLYMADGGYTDDEILRAERYLLQVLDFSLQYPSPMSFLRRTSKADHYDIQTRTLAKYLMEVSLVDHRFLKMPPSLIAAAGLYLARHMLLRGEWNGNLTHYSGYAEEEIYECAELMLDYLAKPVKYEALYKKYSARKFMKAAIFVEDWIQRQDTLILRKPVLALTGGLTPEPVETCQHEDDAAAVHGSQSHGHAEPKQKHSQQTSNSTVVETQEQFQDANEEQCDDGRDEGHDGADEQDADTYRDGNDETSDSSI
ncbi:cyclin-like protein [Entophlyctis helioformis]|nr:cyclin-like protein [Entophlyctis helioformis]